jgi:hypothetical protein
MIEAAELRQWLGEKDETPRREFKLKYVLAGPGNNKHKDELAKDVMSLANTAGRNREDYAHLVIGAGDKLKPDGSRDYDDVRSHGYSRKSILDTVNARCHPALPDLSYSVVEVDSNYYGVIEIPPSPFMHELSRDLDGTSGSWRKGNVPIRRGDEVAPANFQEMTLLRQEKENWGKPAVSPLEQLDEYLTDPSMAAKARKLVIDEAKKLYAVLNNPEFLRKDEDHRYAAIVERMTEYESLVRPFLDLFAAGCHGGGDWLGPVWAEALTIIANPVDRPGGVEALLHLRRYPALLLLYAGGVAAIAGNNYGNLTALLRQTQVRSYGPNKAASFGLSPGRIVSSYDEEHLQEKWHKMPFNCHVVNALKEPLDKYVHSNDQYMENFVRFEYLYALASEAQGNGLIVGSFTWGSEQTRGLQQYPPTNLWIVRDTEEELDRLGADWPPLKSGLFDGPLGRFRAFKKEVDERVSKAAGKFFFGR